MLGRVNAFLLEGRTAEGRRLLEETWNVPLPASVEERINLLRASIGLASLYGWRGLCRSMVGAASASLRRDPGDAEETRFGRVALRATRASLAFNANDRKPLQRFFGWFLPLARRHPELWRPWLANSHLNLLGNEFRLAEFDESIRNPPLPAGRFSALEQAMRLRCLGTRLSNGLELERAAAVYRAAVRKALEAERTPPREAFRASVLMKLARVLARQGDFRAAHEALGDAESLAREIRAASVVRDVDGTRGLVLQYAGHYEESMAAFFRSFPSTRGPLAAGAKSTLDTRPGRWPDAWPASAVRVLHAARSAMLAHRFRTAERLLREVERRARGCLAPQELALSLVVRAQLELEHESPTGVDEARKCLSRAARIVDERGFVGTVLDLNLAITCGWLAIAEGNLPAALRHALDGHAKSRERRDAKFEAEALLLQSALLLERSMPGARLYDRTLNRLGVIEDPAILFRVVANLYLYTWELQEDGLELSDLHIKQIERLRSQFGETRFRELYETHVARPLSERFRDRLLGSG